jgi:hypothetical protein
VGTMGYEKAIAAYAKLDSLETFYIQFNAFIRQDDINAVVSILKGQMPTDN